MFVTHRQKHQTIRKLLLLLGGCLLLVTAFYVFAIASSPTSVEQSWTPQEVAAQFYKYEKSGDFGSSWELFHSQMKEKFSKNDYIQRRAHTFMEGFGVETFDFQIGDATVESAWKMSAPSPVMTDVTRIPVTLLYHSEFGDLKIQQDIYLVKEDEQYRVLWSFSRQN